jgi:type IV pilus assembly protein PilE
MNNSKPRGVTLIELMLVITIIGIMAANSIPAYGAYTLKSRRSDAITTLVAIAARQADGHNTTNSFTADFNVLGYAGGLSQLGHYQLDFVVPPDALQFRIRARPVAGGRQERDVACQWFEIDARKRMTSGPEDCWPK